jgi:hypothetical protein
MLFEKIPSVPPPGRALAASVSVHHTDIPVVYFFTLAISVII